MIPTFSGGSGGLKGASSGGTFKSDFKKSFGGFNSGQQGINPTYLMIAAVIVVAVVVVMKGK